MEMILRDLAPGPNHRLPSLRRRNHPHDPARQEPWNRSGFPRLPQLAVPCEKPQLQGGSNLERPGGSENGDGLPV